MKVYSVDISNLQNRWFSYRDLENFMDFVKKSEGRPIPEIISEWNDKFAKSVKEYVFLRCHKRKEEIVKITHEKINRLKERASQVYAWDFLLADGDTISEKSKDLYDKLRPLLVRKISPKTEAFVVCNKNSILLNHLLLKNEIIPKFKEVAEGIQLIGKVKRSCGDNGYCTDFK